MDFVERVIAPVPEIAEGEMKAFPVDDKKILICKIEGKFYALGSQCPHYSAPLEEGILNGHTLICPWHHSCFDARSGALLEPPAFNSLDKYSLEVVENSIVIKIPDKAQGHHTPPMSKADLIADKRVFAIIGAGAAGYSAAQTLREDGFKGRIVMITYEKRLPYDRPNLSKGYLSGEAPEDWMPLRTDDFYKSFDIEVMTGKRVSLLDTAARLIIFDDGSKLNFDKVLIAAGGTPKLLEAEGEELDNIFYLRTFDDCEQIIKSSEHARNIVIIGNSFIAMETASALRERYKSAVTIISRDNLPFKKVFGNEIGNFIKRSHEGHGIKFKINGVKKFEGSKKVESVILKDDERIPADIVIIGAGVRPALDFVKKGVDFHNDGSIRVNEFLLAAEDIYAAGDVAYFPYWHSGEYTRIEHWRTAEQQGRAAAHNMAGKNRPFRGIPFFWTTQAGITINYIGHAVDWDEVIIHGRVQSKDFIAFYIKNNKIDAAASCNRDKEIAAVHKLMWIGKLPSPSEVRSSTLDILQLSTIRNAAEIRI